MMRKTTLLLWLFLISFTSHFVIIFFNPLHTRNTRKVDQSDGNTPEINPKEVVQQEDSPWINVTDIHVTSAMDVIISKTKPANPVKHNIAIGCAYKVSRVIAIKH